MKKLDKWYVNLTFEGVGRRTRKMKKRVYVTSGQILALELMVEPAMQNNSLQLSIALVLVEPRLVLYA